MFQRIVASPVECTVRSLTSVLDAGALSGRRFSVSLAVSRAAEDADSGRLLLGPPVAATTSFGISDILGAATDPRPAKGAEDGLGPCRAPLKAPGGVTVEEAPGADVGRGPDCGPSPLVAWLPLTMVARLVALIGRPASTIMLALFGRFVVFEF